MISNGPKPNLTQRDLMVFAALLVAFFGLLGLLSLFKPGALLVAATATAIALVISLLLNREQPRSKQLLGLAIPAVLLLAGGVPQIDGLSRWMMPIVLWIGGALLALLTLGRPALGRTVYRVWMEAAMPIGWTFSMVILGVVYYGVFTPIGLLLRLFGRDPMSRKFDRNASTYWLEHRQPADQQQYFRQF